MDIQHKLKPSLFLLTLSLLSSVFVGCSESENDGGITGTGGPLESYLKHGIASNNQNPSYCDICLDAPVLESDGSADASSDESSDSYSRTNTQETGVDELDWLKTDGNLIYSYNGGSDINIFELSEQTGKHEALNTITLSTSRHYLQGLYLEETLENKKLISIANEYAQVYSDYFWHWSDSRISIDMYDVETPESTIDKTTSIQIEGQYVSSRKIGSKLYIISQYSAYLDDYVIYPYEEDDISRNESLISKATLEDLLPSVTLNGQTKILLGENDCHIPNEPEDSTQPTLAIVTEIDLGASHDMALSNIKSSCVAAPIATIYASLNAVYMVENEYIYESTNDSSYSSTVYKLDYSDNGLEFAGSVALSGQVGWNEQFRLSEYQDHLRVVTTDHSSTERNIHRLHTINIDDTELNLNATIPNESAPEAIGKPGESIYSVRFDGDKAYIVTFRQIDPFYVLDLSNHDSPRVAGELELPGFSNYLHPFGDTLVFGLGRGSEGGVATNNIKLALFDVSDMSNPLLVNEVLLEGDTSYSPAEYTHTALSILPGNDEHSWRLGFSASILEDWQWQKDAYYLFEVRDTEHPEGASLNQAGSIVGSELGTGQSGSYYYSSYDRGVLTGTHAHYSHRGYLITELWDDLANPAD